MVRKYNINQRVHFKTTGGGPHKPPPNDYKGDYGTIAEQSTSDWLREANSIHTETPPSYYVVAEDGSMQLIGEDWLEPA
jgi:hypothetical protein